MRLLTEVRGDLAAGCGTAAPRRTCSNWRSSGRTSASDWRRIAKSTCVGGMHCGSWHEAEAEFGRHPVLERERQSYAEALGLPDRARAAAERCAAFAPISAWEHYSLGSVAVRRRRSRGRRARVRCGVSTSSPRTSGPISLGAFAPTGSGISMPRSRRSTSASPWPRRPLNATTTGRERTRRWGRPRPRSATTITPWASPPTSRSPPSIAASSSSDRGALKRRSPTFSAPWPGGQTPRERHYNLALAYLVQGDPAAARTNLEAALRLAPGEKAFHDLECRLPRNPRAEAGPRIERNYRWLPIRVRRPPHPARLIRTLPHPKPKEIPSARQLLALDLPAPCGPLENREQFRETDLINLSGLKNSCGVNSLFMQEVFGERGFGGSTGGHRCEMRTGAGDPSALDQGRTWRRGCEIPIPSSLRMDQRLQEFWPCPYTTREFVLY